MRVARTKSIRRAASAVELALVLPVLTTLGLACLDFGRFAYHHIAVANAARAGGEYAITNSYTPDREAAWQSQVQLTARSELTDQTGADPARLTTAVAVTAERTGRRRVRVETTYTGFHTLVSWPGVPDNPVMRSVVVLPVIR
jgi:Flp pilus assembly protein TadG